MKHLTILLLALVGASVAVHAAVLKTPSPPTAQIVGKAGNRSLCYWVFAESAQQANTTGAWYLMEFPGEVTNLSQPCIVTNAPDALDANNKVVLTLKPVEGAVKYHVFKTELLPAPRLEITVKKPGADTLYYWVQGHNGWRNSLLGGPFPVKCDVQDFANTITVYPGSLNQFKHSIWVTKTPDVPYTRGFNVVSLYSYHSKFEMPRYPVSFTQTQARMVTLGPGVFEVTAPEVLPEGTGKFLLASVAAGTLTVEDTGAELKLTQAPSINETLPQTFEQRFNQPQSSRYVHNGNYFNSVINRKSSMENDYYGGYYPLELNATVESGGIYEYELPPDIHSGPGYKSTMGLFRASLDTRTCGQYSANDTMLNAYGAGDSVVMGLFGNFHGGNREGGDEGGSLLRTFITRSLDESTVTLTKDASKGTRYLATAGDAGSGTGRILTNLSQAQHPGRIDHVVNCDVFGASTNWTPALRGSFLSFDIDNVNGKRSWFEIAEVLSPTHLKVLMITNWRCDINLGYSRFIYNPQRGQTLPTMSDTGLTYGGPEVTIPTNALFAKLEKDDPELLKHKELLYTNPWAISKLPKALEGEAAKGNYLMAPGTYFDDPWRANGQLHVEALGQDWHAGDKLDVAIGTGQGMTFSWGWIDGQFGPNDFANGYNCGAYIDNRPINGSAFNAANMQLGVNITLPNERMGNGVIVKGEPLDGAYLGAPDVPLLRCYHSQIPYMQGSLKAKAMQIVAPGGETPLAVAKDRVSVSGTLVVDGALHGSAATRGKAVFTATGKQTRFTITFARPLTSEPVITLSTNQFARCRLASVSTRAFVVEFEEAPKQGKENLTIWWMAQE